MNAFEDVFTPAFGNKPDPLVGREDVIADFVTGLEGKPGNRKRTSLYIGQRGMGKTALLLELSDRAQKMGFVTARVMDNERMLDEIIQLIQLNGSNSLKTNALNGSKPVKAVSVGALGFSLGLTFNEETDKNYGFRVKLSLLCQELAKHDKGVLILIDEVQSSSVQMREFAGAYQNLIGDGTNIAVAMAGLPATLSEVLSDSRLTFLNRANKIELAELDINDVSAFYRDAFAKSHVEAPAGLIDKAAECSRGYPYLVQLLGYHLLRAAGDKGALTETDLEFALLAAKRDLTEDLYAPALRPASQTDRKFLEAMAQSGVQATVADIKERMHVSQAMVQQYRARMIAAGIVAPVARGQLEFLVPYLDEHLRGEF